MRHLLTFSIFNASRERSRSPTRGETESASVLAGVSPIFRLLRSCRESLKETITCYPLVLMPWAQPGSHLFHFGGERRKIKAFSSRRNGIGLCVGWSLSDLSAAPLLSRKLEGNHQMLSTCPHALGTTRLAPFPFWRRARQDQGPLLEEKRNRPLCWLESLRSFGCSALVAKA